MKARGSTFAPWKVDGRSILDSANQRHGKPKSSAQLIFQCGHFAAIALVIMAPKVQQPMQHQNAKFLIERVPELPRLPGRSVNRNSQVARNDQLPRIELGKGQ